MAAAAAIGKMTLHRLREVDVADGGSAAGGEEGIEAVPFPVRLCCMIPAARPGVQLRAGRRRPSPSCRGGGGGRASPRALLPALDGRHVAFEVCCNLPSKNPAGLQGVSRMGDVPREEPRPSQSPVWSAIVTNPGPNCSLLCRQRHGKRLYSTGGFQVTGTASFTLQWELCAYLRCAIPCRDPNWGGFSGGRIFQYHTDFSVSGLQIRF